MKRAGKTIAGPRPYEPCDGIGDRTPRATRVAGRPGSLAAGEPRPADPGAPDTRGRGRPGGRRARVAPPHARRCGRRFTRGRPPLVRDRSPEGAGRAPSLLQAFAEPGRLRRPRRAALSRSYHDDDPQL